MNIRFWPYKMGSSGAKELSKSMDALRVKSDGKYVPKSQHVIINWGNSELPNWMPIAMKRDTVFLNTPMAVHIASNKLDCLRILRDKGVTIPLFETDIKEAEALFLNSRRVYCRTLLRSHGGKGIVVAEKPEELVKAPLYTCGIDKKRKEYRVHIFCNEVIDYVQKMRMSQEHLEANNFEFNSVIRNHDFGWVFARDSVDLPDEVAVSALQAIEALGLDFGAVDIIVREKDPTAYVLEVNTAPGLEGTTLERYKERITRLFD